MNEVLSLILVRFGIPVVVLFAIGYLAYRFQRRPGAAFDRAGTEELSDFNHGKIVPQRLRPSHCWEIKGCPLAKRASCPAYNRRYLPCWMALKLANGGHLNHECLNCPLFRPTETVGDRERVSSG